MFLFYFNILLAMQISEKIFFKQIINEKKTDIFLPLIFGLLYLNINLKHKNINT